MYPVFIQAEGLYLVPSARGGVEGLHQAKPAVTPCPSPHLHVLSGCFLDPLHPPVVWIMLGKPPS